jgi:hypothetical protein
MVMVQKVARTAAVRARNALELFRVAQCVQAVTHNCVYTRYEMNPEETAAIPAAFYFFSYPG